MGHFTREDIMRSQTALREAKEDMYRSMFGENFVYLRLCSYLEATKLNGLVAITIFPEELFSELQNFLGEDQTWCNMFEFFAFLVYKGLKIEDILADSGLYLYKDDYFHERYAVKILEMTNKIQSLNKSKKHLIKKWINDILEQKR